MKSIIYILITLSILTPSLLSQERDSLIQLYPGLGDTLDLFNRNYFEIFQSIDGFEYAVFYIRNNEYVVSKVTYSTTESLRETIFIQKFSALLDARTRIDEIVKENEEKFESPLEIIIEAKNGNKYKCNLEMFSKGYLFFISEENLLGSNSTELKYKLPLSKVENLILVGESNAWSSMGWGALIATGVSLIGVLASNNGYAIFGVPFFAAFGAIVGLVVGLISSTDDETIQFNSQLDALKLKDQVKYYFRYEETIDQRYIEIE